MLAMSRYFNRFYVCFFGGEGRAGGSSLSSGTLCFLLWHLSFSTGQLLKSASLCLLASFSSPEFISYKNAPLIHVQFVVPSLQFMLSAAQKLFSIFQTIISDQHKFPSLIPFSVFPAVLHGLPLLIQKPGSRQGWGQKCEKPYTRIW